MVGSRYGGRGGIREAWNVNMIKVHTFLEIIKQLIKVLHSFKNNPLNSNTRALKYGTMWTSKTSVIHTAGQNWGVWFLIIHFLQLILFWGSISPCSLAWRRMELAICNLGWHRTEVLMVVPAPHLLCRENTAQHTLLWTHWTSENNCLWKKAGKTVG